MRIFALASDSELQFELEWARGRPASKRNNSSDRTGAHSEFEAALTPTESRWLRKYEQLCGDSGAAVSLGQDPDCHAMHNAGKFTLGAIIKNSGIVYSTIHHRWLAPSEFLATQCFPVFPDLSAHGETCSFSKCRSALGLPPRRRAVIIEQAGNSMNLNMIGVAWLWWLLTDVHASRVSASPLLHAVLEAAAFRVVSRADSNQLGHQDDNDDGSELPRAGLPKRRRVLRAHATI